VARNCLFTWEKGFQTYLDLGRGAFISKGFGLNWGGLLALKGRKPIFKKVLGPKPHFPTRELKGRLYFAPGSKGGDQIRLLRKDWSQEGKAKKGGA